MESSEASSLYITKLEQATNFLSQQLNEQWSMALALAESIRGQHQTVTVSPRDPCWFSIYGATSTRVFYPPHTPAYKGGSPPLDADIIMALAKGSLCRHFSNTGICKHFNGCSYVHIYDFGMSHRENQSQFWNVMQSSTDPSKDRKPASSTSSSSRKRSRSPSRNRRRSRSTERSSKGRRSNDRDRRSGNRDRPRDRNHSPHRESKIQAHSAPQDTPRVGSSPERKAQSPSVHNAPTPPVPSEPQKAASVPPVSPALSAASTEPEDAELSKVVDQLVADKVKQLQTNDLQKELAKARDQAKAAQDRADRAEAQLAAAATSKNRENR